MDSEFTPLSGGRRGKASLYLWWALNILLVLFVFLAFVLSAASLAQEHQLANQINNSIVNNQATRVLASLKVAQNHHVEKGYLVSYTDNPNEVARGLGPQWDTPLPLREGFSSAEFESLHSLSNSGHVYAFTTIREPNVLRVNIITNNESQPLQLGSETFQRQPENETILFIHARGLSANHFVVVYTTWHNDTGENTYYVFGVTEPGYKHVSLQAPVHLNQSWVPLVKHVQVFRENSYAYLQIGIGGFGQSCNFLYYSLNINLPGLVPLSNVGGGFKFQCTWPMNGQYLGNGYFVLVNSFHIALGLINFAATPTVSPVRQEELGVHHFDFYIGISHVHTKNYIILSGSQSIIEGPSVMTQVIAWSPTAPYLTVHNPTSLLPSVRLAAYRGEIASCFIEPDNGHPTGTLLFTYVDDFTGLAMVVRGKIDVFGNYVWVLPSPHIRVSNVPYYNFETSNRTAGPRLHCPPSYGKAIIAYQSEPTTLNSFYWHGGYRLAGFAENEAAAGQAVQVVRVGTTDAPYGLQPGFSYYANNTGEIHSMISLNEVFSPFGYPFRVGVAVSESLLLLDFEIIDRINNAWY